MHLAVQHIMDMSLFCVCFVCLHYNIKVRNQHNLKKANGREIKLNREGKKFAQKVIFRMLFALIYCWVEKE